MVVTLNGPPASAIKIRRRESFERSWQSRIARGTRRCPRLVGRTVEEVARYGAEGRRWHRRRTCRGRCRAGGPDPLAVAEARLAERCRGAQLGLAQRTELLRHHRTEDVVWRAGRGPDRLARARSRVDRDHRLPLEDVDAVHHRLQEDLGVCNIVRGQADAGDPGAVRLVAGR